MTGSVDNPEAAVSADRSMSDPTPHSREALAARFGPNYRWMVLLTVMIGTMASIMSSTIINVAVPT